MSATASRDPRQKGVGTHDLLRYEPAPWAGKNRSGYRPLDDKVVFLPHVVSKRTRGGIELPDDPHEKEQMRIEYGRIVAMGPAAFSMSGDRVRLWELSGIENPKPQVGSIVFIERYSGQLLDGLDGHQYRVIDDKCVAAVLEEPSE